MLRRLCALRPNTSGLWRQTTRASTSAVAESSAKNQSQPHTIVKHPVEDANTSNAYFAVIKLSGTQYKVTEVRASQPHIPYTFRTHRLCREMSSSQRNSKQTSVPILTWTRSVTHLILAHLGMIGSRSRSFLQARSKKRSLDIHSYTALQCVLVWKNKHSTRKSISSKKSVGKTIADGMDFVDKLRCYG